MAATTNTYLDRRITATDSDGKPAHVEATVSIGEFAGLLLAIETPNFYQNVELDLEHARELRDALTKAIKILTDASHASR